MRFRHWLLIVLLSLASPIDMTFAADRTAIVEEIDEPSLQLQPMDYVAEWQVIVLKPTESIVLGYLASCRLERITGGLVTIGRMESRVLQGELRSSHVECDGGRMNLSPDQAAKGASLVVRLPPGKTADATGRALPTPTVTLFSIYPVIDVGSGSAIVTIERLDVPAQPLIVGTARHWVDLADLKRELAPGGLYRTSGGGRSVVFRIGPGARRSGGPILGRLLVL